MQCYFEVCRQSRLMVPLRDGTCLATDVYLPAMHGKPLTGPFPTLIERTPYDRTGSLLAQDCQFFARRGYAAVAQDVRGRFDSQGTLDPFGPGDIEDSSDVCDWILRQAWCDGSIGSMGTSYCSMNQGYMALGKPAGLTAQFMNQGFSNQYHGRMRQGGALRLSMVSWVFAMASNSPAALADRGLRRLLEESQQHIQDWLAKGPLRRGQTPLRHLPEYENHMIQIMTRGELDDWWRQKGRWIEDFWDELADIPRYLASGWYDSHSHVMTAAFTALQQRQKSPVRLIMGPWTHSSIPGHKSGEADFGVEAALEWNELRLAWFDEMLSGHKPRLADEAPVRLFVMGGGDGRQVRHASAPLVSVGGRWRDELAWPLARTDYRPFYLRRDGSLTQDPPSGAEGSTTYRYDPADPVPTVGGPISSAFSLRMMPGAYDQHGRPELGHANAYALNLRQDVLVFQTPPLSCGVEVTGPVTAVLFVSSQAADTDFTVKLVDVHPPSEDFPDGLALNVTDGIRRARYRNGWCKPQLLEPGEVVELQVELPPTSLFFAPGHCIRVDVSSSNWPRFDLNPNTGDPSGQHRRSQVAENTVYHQAAYPSHIILPLIPC